MVVMAVKSAGDRGHDAGSAGDMSPVYPASTTPMAARAVYNVYV